VFFNNNQIDGNQISDISPLAKLTDLRALYLDGNQITDISAIAGLTKIGTDWDGWLEERNGVKVHLGLSYNQIENINPLVENKGISEGDVIDLTGNPLNEEAYNIHIPALEERGVLILFDPNPQGEMITNPSNGHGYMLVYKGMTWREAKAYAEELRGYLATITSFEEQDWICQHFQNVRFWLGGTDEEVEGEWKWVTGEEWAYMNWAPGEPNNSDIMGDGREENALEMRLAPNNPEGLWNDVPSDTFTVGFYPTSLLVEFDSPNDQK